MENITSQLIDGVKNSKIDEVFSQIETLLRKSTITIPSQIQANINTLKQDFASGRYGADFTPRLIVCIRQIKTVNPPSEESEPSVQETNEWYSFANDFGEFNDPTARYILIIGPNFRQKLSEYDVNSFAKSSVKWHLVIDFDHETQQKGIEKAFKNVLGKEKMRSLTKGDQVPDVDALYYFLAQGNSSLDVETLPVKWQNSYGKALENILIKNKPRYQTYVLIINNDVSFVSEALNSIYSAYSSLAKKINIGIITDDENDRVALSRRMGDRFPEVFKVIHYYSFDFSKIIQEGFALQKKQTQTSTEEYLVPSFSNERREHTFISLPPNIFDDIQSKHIEIVHKSIGKAPVDDDSGFYLGNEITWQDLYYLGKGKDIERYKVTNHILPEILGLLDHKSKGFWVYRLNHDASAGGTTAAKRIAYEIGARLPNSFPTVLIHKYLFKETAEAIANLYEITQDKTVLAVMEEYKVGEKQLSRLAEEIHLLQKNVVVLYVCRRSSSKEEAKKSRQLPSELQDEEITIFENLFINQKPEKKEDLLGIKDQDTKFRTPFIYGLTAFGKDFKKLDTYINHILDRLTEQKVRKFLGFVALIGRYSQNPIPEPLFHKYLGIDGIQDNWSVLFTLDEKERENITKVFTFFPVLENGVEVPCIKVRHKYFAEEISERLLASRNPNYKNLWIDNLKTWVLDLIQVFKNAYPEEQLYALDKKLIDALFIDKNNASDESERSPFSKLITQIISIPNGYSQGREILESLVNAFHEYADDAFYSQHLARLYYNSIRKEQGLSLDDKLLFYSKATEKADNAIKLYRHNPESNKSLSTLYHTKGHALVLQMEFINNNIEPITKAQHQYFENIEDTVKQLYDSASSALEECLALDENSTYGYASSARLIVNILNFGRQISGHKDFVDFLEDKEYEWYINKRDLGVEIITKALDFWEKYNNREYTPVPSNVPNSEQGEGDEFTNENNQQTTGWIRTKKSKFEEIMEGNLARLSLFRDFENEKYKSKINSAKTPALRTLWHNAYIEKIISDNPQSSFQGLNMNELKEITEFLRFNLENNPTLRDFKRWMKAIRHESFDIDVQQATNLIEFFNRALDQKNNGNLVFKIKIAYYLYCLYIIQILNEGQSFDSTKRKKFAEYQNYCRSKASTLAFRKASSFEWLGKNEKNGLEQLVSKDSLGDMQASRQDFFADHSRLKEVTGTIKSVGSGSTGTERKTGEIELDGLGISVFFVPIRGGYIVNGDGTLSKCRFDNTNNINTRVKFFLGFSYDGLRAYQAIPEEAQRAEPKTEIISPTKTTSQNTPKTVPVSAKKVASSQPGVSSQAISQNETGKVFKTNQNHSVSQIRVKVRDVNRHYRKLYCVPENDDGANLIPVAFAKGKSYDDYKDYPGQIINIIKDKSQYKIVT